MSQSLGFPPSDTSEFPHYRRRRRRKKKRHSIPATKGHLIDPSAEPLVTSFDPSTSIIPTESKGSVSEGRYYHNDDDGDSSVKGTTSEKVIHLDGSVMEGGGQVLRNCVALAALTKQPIQITRIRGGRKKPGLLAQHMTGVSLIQSLKGGMVSGNRLYSEELSYDPNAECDHHPPSSEEDCKSHSHNIDDECHTITADCRTAGSISLMLQISLPCLLFFSDSEHSQRIIHFGGGTNVNFAPQLDYTQQVFIPLFCRLFKLPPSHIDLKCEKRGFFPSGGGRVTLKINSMEKGEYLPSFELVESGGISRIRIIGVISRIEESSANEVAKKMQSELHSLFEHSIENTTDIEWDISVRKEDAIDVGCMWLILVETSLGGMISSSSVGSIAQSRGAKKKRSGMTNTVGSKKKSALMERVSREAMEKMRDEWMENGRHGGCVDQYLQDELIIWMALARGRSRLRCGALTLRSETSIHFCRLMLGVCFEITPVSLDSDQSCHNPCVILECEGIGFLNP